MAFYNFVFQPGVQIGARRLRIRSYFAVELDVNSLTATTHTHADTFMPALRIMKDMAAATHMVNWS